jgi:2-desacetyl-2-hydroxyethyl bacteriochlorophyllide A dehydrogenase
MRAQALAFTAVNAVELLEVEIPEPQAGEVLIQTELSSVSPGTELRCLAGLQANLKAWPFIPGYALVGTVIALGSGVILPLGSRVFCTGTQHASLDRMWGGHVSHAVAPASSVFVIPDGVTWLASSLTALASIAQHGLRLSRPQVGERIAVIGLGAIGQLSAQLHALNGAEVAVTDSLSSRRDTARACGLNVIEPEGNLRETFASVFPDGADVIVDATGSAAVFAQALEVARIPSWHDPLALGGRYLIQGSYVDGLHVPYDPVFQRELQLLFPRDTQPRDRLVVLEMMAQGKLELAPLVQEFAVRDAPRAYAALQSPEAGLVTVAFRWHDAQVG